MRTIGILALDRVFDSALIMTRDVLAAGRSASNRDGGARVTSHRMVSVGGRPIRTANDLRIVPDGGLSSADAADLVVVPSWGLEGTDDLGPVLARLETREARSAGCWLRRLHARGATIAAGCTATFLLAEAGLLEGLQATTSWWAADTFRTRYPGADLQPHMMLTNHDRVVCAGAAMAHLDLALWAVTAVYGLAVADGVARALLLDERSSQARYMAVNHLTLTDPDVLRAEAWIRAHLSEPISIDDIAAALALSARTLARRFVQATGEAPLRFVQRLRVEHAVHLLETSDLAFDAIAARVGYREPAGLRRVLRRLTGRTPSAFRQARRQSRPQRRR